MRRRVRGDPDGVARGRFGLHSCAGRQHAARQRLRRGHRRARLVEGAGPRREGQGRRGARVAAGDTLVVLATTDADLALRRARPSASRRRAAAAAPGRAAGRRTSRRPRRRCPRRSPSDTRPRRNSASARADEARFEQLLQTHAGSQKQRDDAVTRRELAEARLGRRRPRARGHGHARSAEGRRAAGGTGRRARRASRRSTRRSPRSSRTGSKPRSRRPSAGIVSSRLVEPGELVAPARRSSCSSISTTRGRACTSRSRSCRDCKIDQPATVVTDAGDRLDRPDHVHVARRPSSRRATSRRPAERAKLVYRVKVSVDNRHGHAQARHARRGRFRAGGQVATADAPSRSSSCRASESRSARPRAVDGLSFAVGARRDVRRDRPGRRRQDHDAAA